jgi:phage-related minor tail protein
MSLETDFNEPSEGLLKLELQMAQLNRVSATLGRSLTEAFAQGSGEGRRFEQVLSGVGAKLIGLATSSAARGFDQMLGQALAGALQRSPTGVGNGPQVTAFAEGGVVSSPTFFQASGLNGGVGLAGERGAEAIMPLARGPDGRLGVAAQGGARPVSVHVNIAATDVDSFRRSEAQISAALARAVARGGRSL